MVPISRTLRGVDGGCLDSQCTQGTPQESWRAREGRQEPAVPGSLTVLLGLKVFRPGVSEAGQPVSVYVQKCVNVSV